MEAVNNMVTFSDIDRVRSKMYIGMKMHLQRKDSFFERDVIKKQVTVCALNEEHFTVKWYGAMGDLLKEGFKYIDLILGDCGIEVA